MGPPNPNEWGNAQNTIRGQFGTDEIQNVAYGSVSEGKADEDAGFFFGDGKKRFAQTAVFDNCTLCIVKPHVFQQGAAGKLIDDILARGFVYQQCSYSKSTDRTSKSFSKCTRKWCQNMRIWSLNCYQDHLFRWRSEQRMQFPHLGNLWDQTTLKLHAHYAHTPCELDTDMTRSAMECTALICLKMVDWRWSTSSRCYNNKFFNKRKKTKK